MFLEVKEPSEITAILVDPDDARREMVTLTLGSGDISLMATCKTVSEALAYSGAYDLTVYYAQSANAQAKKDVERLSQAAEASVLVLLEADDREAIEALLNCGADHVLPVGLSADRLFVATVSALAVRRKMHQTKGALEKIPKDLMDMKSIARAKMILISRHGIGEEEAHRRVQKMSMKRNLTLAQMAQQIIDAEDLLC